ncbi:MAG: S8/S53 family peptidase [Jiangellaceae bacterium]|nr:S8/S53 family peptidase [Jiangellaceae bacterium]
MAMDGRERDPSLGWVRLLVRVPADLTRKAESERYLRQAVRRHLGSADVAGDRWRIERLFGNTRREDLRRWWVVSGAVPSVTAYDASRVAYDLATRLSAQVDLLVEPDVPSTAFGPEPGAVEPTEPLPESAGAELSCSRPETWALDAVRAREAWALPTPQGGRSRGEGIRIGHIDTGYSDHPELERAALDLAADFDVIDSDDDARDPLRRAFFAILDTPGHGTSTGSVIAGRERGEISGVAPAATLVPFRAIKSVVQVLDSDVARAVNLARERGCHVISMSLGGTGFIGLQEAIAAAVSDGLIVMAAAGNKVTFVVAPASYPECLAVAATNCDSRPWSGSSRGGAVDISAPGESVWTARVDVETRPPRFFRARSDGTSYSVATLAGVAALWLAHHGPERIRQQYGRANVQSAFLGLLRSHGRRVPPDWLGNGWHRRYGVGIVDALALLQAGLPDVPDTAVPEAVAPGVQLPVARIQAALGDLDEDQVRAAIADLLDLEAARVDELPPVVVSELVYRLGEDDQFRDAVLAQALGLELPPVPGLEARSLLDRTASASLRGRMRR